MAVFQSTHPCGVRLKNGNRMLIPKEFQSTHPCGVRLKISRLNSPYGLVSIHAPLRGATAEAEAEDANWAVSIHAPLRGAT